MAHRRVIDCSWDENTKLASVTLSRMMKIWTWQISGLVGILQSTSAALLCSRHA